jgi:hypothetical protein
VKRPAFQFYPADWRNNAKLRRCSPAARGVWIDVLCVLHDSDEYGVCRWPLIDLANAAGAPVKLVRELVEKEVLKGDDKLALPYIHTPRHAGKDGEPVTLVPHLGGGPCWYSTRLVRDEWVRGRRGGSTRFDSENQPPNRAPIDHPPAGSVSSQETALLSSSSSSKKKEKPPAAPSLTVEELEAEGLTSETAIEYLALRNRKQARLTRRAWEQIKPEFRKAGWTPERAVLKCLARGWVAFESDWIKDAKTRAADLVTTTVPADPDSFNRTREAPMTPEQQEAARRAKELAMGAIKNITPRLAA